MIQIDSNNKYIEHTESASGDEIAVFVSLLEHGATRLLLLFSKAMMLIHNGHRVSNLDTDS